MAQSQLRALQNAVQSLRTAVAAVIDHFDEVSRVVERISPESLAAPEPADHGDLRIDSATYSVVWRGRACRLRNGLPFRLMQVLARRRRQYLTVQELLETVWEEEERSRTAVRNVVWLLRRRLAEGGMEDLADMIDGSCRGHYALALPMGR